MANTTNVDANYEINVMEWDPEKEKIKERNGKTVESSRDREVKEGCISVKAYDGGYPEREEQEK